MPKLPHGVFQRCSIFSTQKQETWALITWLVYAGYLHTRPCREVFCCVADSTGFDYAELDLCACSTRLQLGWDTRESAKIGAFGFLVGAFDGSLQLRGTMNRMAQVVWVCYIGVATSVRDARVEHERIPKRLPKRFVCVLVTKVNLMGIGLHSYGFFLK